MPESCKLFQHNLNAQTLSLPNQNCHPGGCFMSGSLTHCHWLPSSLKTLSHPTCFCTIWLHEQWSALKIAVVPSPLLFLMFGRSCSYTSTKQTHCPPSDLFLQKAFSARPPNWQITILTIITFSFHISCSAPPELTSITWTRKFWGLKAISYLCITALSAIRSQSLTKAAKSYTHSY